MTNEFGHLASIAAVGVAAGFFIMGVHQAAPGQPVAPVAGVPTAASEQPPPYEEGSARLLTQSVLGGSSSAIDPASYRPAPKPDPDVQGIAGPVPDLPEDPLRLAVTGVGEGKPRAWLGGPGRSIEGDRPLVEQRVETSTWAFVERERIRGALRPERMVRPIERREERRVFARGGANPVLGQGARRGFGGGGFGGGRGGAPGGRR